MTRKSSKQLFVALVATVLASSASIAAADDADDVMAVVNQYIATESNLTEQAKLMTDDRTYIVGGARFTDNVANMRGQIAGEKLRKTLDPDGMMIVTAEDPKVQVYGDTAPPSQVTTVVLNKMRGDWKIVHTHISPMAN
jgi:hypothetical protein